MAAREEEVYLAEKVRSVCDDRPFGFDPWKGREIHALLDRASRFSGDHELFFLAFLEGARELLEDEDTDAIADRNLKAC